MEGLHLFKGDATGSDRRGGARCTEASQRRRCKSKGTRVMQHRAAERAMERGPGGSRGGKRPGGLGSGTREEPAGPAGLRAGPGPRESRVTRAGGGGAGEERSADNGRRRSDRGRPAGRGLGETGFREGPGSAGCSSHRDRCFKICFLMIPAMPQRRPACRADRQPWPPQLWRRGAPSPRRGAGTGCRNHSGRHGALSPPPRRPEFRHVPTHPRARAPRRSLPRRRAATAPCRTPSSRLPVAKARGEGRGRARRHRRTG